MHQKKEKRDLPKSASSNYEFLEKKNYLNKALETKINQLDYRSSNADKDIYNSFGELDIKDKDEIDLLSNQLLQDSIKAKDLDKIEILICSGANLDNIKLPENYFLDLPKKPKLSLPHLLLFLTKHDVATFKKHLTNIKNQKIINFDKLPQNTKDEFFTRLLEIKGPQAVSILLKTFKTFSIYDLFYIKTQASLLKTQIENSSSITGDKRHEFKKYFLNLDKFLADKIGFKSDELIHDFKINKSLETESFDEYNKLKGILDSFFKLCFEKPDLQKLEEIKEKYLEIIKIIKIIKIINNHYSPDKKLMRLEKELDLVLNKYKKELCIDIIQQEKLDISLLENLKKQSLTSRLGVIEESQVENFYNTYKEIS